MRNEEIIERAGAHLVACRELLTTLDEASALVRTRPAAVQARSAIEESMALTRALVMRVKTELLEVRDGDKEQ